MLHSLYYLYQWYQHKYFFFSCYLQIFHSFIGHLRCFVAIFLVLIFLGPFLHLCYFNHLFHLWGKLLFTQVFALAVKLIPHICHRHHRRCLCKFFLPGVIFFQIKRKKLAFYCIIIWDPLCNITQCMQCIILYTECNSHSMCNYTHTNVTQRIPSFCTQCVVLHTVYTVQDFH